MKLIKRDPLRFDVFNALVQFSQTESISLGDPKTMEGFIDRMRLSADSAMANESFVYGQRTQAMFEALVVSLGKVKVLKQEDYGEIYSADEKIKVPDERLLLLGGKQVLIEVKNFYQKGDPFEAMDLKEEYVDGLDRYAKLMDCEWRLATYWSRWNQWTLVSPSRLKPEIGKAFLSYQDAMMFNEMAELGNMMIGTKFPLVITVVANRDKPRTVESDGKASFLIADMKISCAGQVLKNESERNIAWYMIMHGNWEEQEPQPRISNGLVDEIRFEWLPETYHDDPEKYEEQGFAIIGSLSGMFSKYYKQMTQKDGQIGQLRVDVAPGSLGQMIPDDYEGESLPLWRLVLKPSDNSKD